MKFSKSLAAAALWIGLVAAAHAGPVMWGPAQNTSGVGDVSLTGTLVEAFNLTGALAPPPTTTVNGVTFTNTNLLLNASSNANFLGGNTSGNASYDALLNGLDFGNGNPFTLMIGGGALMVGADYQLQVWYTDIRTGFESRVMSYGSSAADLVALTSTGSNAGAARLGQFAIGTFTATAGTQSLYLQTNGFANVHLSAYQVRTLPESNDVPEPATLLLLGAALVGLAGASRRRR